MNVAAYGASFAVIGGCWTTWLCSPGQAKIQSALCSSFVRSSHTGRFLKIVPIRDRKIARIRMT